MSSSTGHALGDEPREDWREAGWAMIHENLCRLAEGRAAADVEEAKWLLAGMNARVHEPLGFGSFLEYAERVLGYTPKVGAERIRVARAFAELPALRDSVRRGELVPLDETCAEMVRCDAQLVTVDPGTRVETSHPHVGAGGGSTKNTEQTENTGSNISTGSSRRTRATQTVPPATRREIVRRHHGRCAVRGCRHAGFLHQHHRTSLTRQSRLAAATRHLRSVGLPEHEAVRLVRSVADELPGNDALTMVVDAALRRWATTPPLTRSPRGG